MITPHVRTLDSIRAHGVAYHTPNDIVYNCGCNYSTKRGEWVRLCVPHQDYDEFAEYAFLLK